MKHPILLLTSLACLGAGAMPSDDMAAASGAWGFKPLNFGENHIKPVPRSPDGTVSEAYVVRKASDGIGAFRIGCSFSHMSFIYYKASYTGVPNNDIQPLPKGLRMITGNARNSTGDADHSRYVCLDLLGDNTFLGHP